MVELWIWGVFLIAVGLMLAADLLLIHRHATAISMRESAAWTAFWIAVALAFGGIVWWWQGGGQAIEYLTGYAIEKTLSMDNIFVFLFIFSFFSIPPQYQYRVLFWGILGAVVTRGTLIIAGVALIHLFEWVLFIFGAFLVYTGVQMFRHAEVQFDPQENPVLRLFRRFVPTTEEIHGQRFFVRQGGALVATPLFVALLLIESTDVVFALDSIPAIFAVTRDPFIVFTSNVFAILGLRALYFFLAGMVSRFRYLRPGLAILLAVIGAKMIVGEFVEIPIWVTLGTVLGILGASVLASLVAPPKIEVYVGIPDPLQALFGGHEAEGEPAERRGDRE